MKELDFAPLIALDKKGIFPYETEDAEKFLARVTVTGDEDALPADLSYAKAIPPGVIAEGGEITEKLYAFRREGDRGFFLSRGVGLLWGGCAVTDVETKRSFFLLRAAFADREKWFCYRRDELLAHELCHVARASLNDPALEEYFAYQTSFSSLRRAIGDLFSTSYDAAIFLVPTLLLPLASFAKWRWFPALPIGYFYALLGAVMGFFAIRLYCHRRLISRARKKLVIFGVRQPLAVLFRATKKEIAEIAEIADLAAWQKWLTSKSEHFLRWKIISRRFCA